MQKGFKKLTPKEEKKIVGGFGWGAMLALAVPLIINSITQAVSAFKIIGSSKGSVKYQGYESHWEDGGHSKKEKQQHVPPVTRTLVYEY